MLSHSVCKLDYFSSSDSGGLIVRLWEIRNDAISDRLIALAGLFHQPFAAQHGELPPSRGHQSGALEGAQRMRHSRPLHAKHLREQRLGDLQHIAVAPV